MICFCFGSAYFYFGRKCCLTRLGITSAEWLVSFYSQLTCSADSGKFPTQSEWSATLVQLFYQYRKSGICTEVREYDCYGNNSNSNILKQFSAQKKIVKNLIYENLKFQVSWTWPQSMNSTFCELSFTHCICQQVRTSSVYTWSGKVRTFFENRRNSTSFELLNCYKLHILGRNEICTFWLDRPSRLVIPESKQRNVCLD